MRDRGGGGVGHGARIFNAINAPYSRLAFRGGQCRTRIMHALFGMSQTRQGGTRPEPSLPPFSLPNLRLRSLTMDRLPGAAIFPHTCSRLCQRPRRSFSSCEGKIGILVFLADNGDKRFGKIDRPLVFWSSNQFCNIEAKSAWLQKDFTNGINRIPVSSVVIQNYVVADETIEFLTSLLDVFYNFIEGNVHRIYRIDKFNVFCSLWNRLKYNAN